MKKVYNKFTLEEFSLYCGYFFDLSILYQIKKMRKQKVICTVYLFSFGFIKWDTRNM